MEVWDVDTDGRNSLIGYGTAFLPFKTGKIFLPIYCWRPSDSVQMSISEDLLGNTAEFINKSAVYSSEEKFGIAAVSTGSINLELDIIMKDFDLHGIMI